MGTKNEPGKFDCYAAAGNDEPMFVLLGRDPMAPFLVLAWVSARVQMGNREDEKLTEAVLCAGKMFRHAAALGKSFDLGRATSVASKMFGDGKDPSPEDLRVLLTAAAEKPELVIEGLRRALAASKR